MKYIQYYSTEEEYENNMQDVEPHIIFIDDIDTVHIKHYRHYLTKSGKHYDTSDGRPYNTEEENKES